jgi:hypothetical protein
MKIINLRLNSLFSISLLFIAVTFSVGCKKDPVNVLSKSITDFNVLKPDSTSFDKDEISMVIIDDSIKVTVPIYADLKNLIPDIKILPTTTISQKPRSARFHKAGYLYCNGS